MQHPIIKCYAFLYCFALAFFIFPSTAASHLQDLKDKPVTHYDMLKFHLETIVLDLEQTLSEFDLARNPYYQTHFDLTQIKVVERSDSLGLMFVLEGDKQNINPENCIIESHIRASLSALKFLVPKSYHAYVDIYAFLRDDFQTEFTEMCYLGNIEENNF